MKDYVISPFALRVGAVLEWTSVNFGSPKRKLRGVLESLYSQTDNVVGTFNNVVDAETGEAVPGNRLISEDDRHYLSLSHVTKMVSIPADAPFAFSQKEEVRETLEGITCSAHLVREVFGESGVVNLYGSEFDLPSSSLRRVLSVFLDDFNSTNSKFKLKGSYCSTTVLRELMLVMLMDELLRSKQPLATASFNITNEFIRAHFPEMFEGNSPVWTAPLPSLSKIRSVVRKHKNRLFVSQKTLARQEREYDAKQRELEAMYDPYED